MPFVADKVITLMKHILKKGADLDIDTEDDAHLKALADDGDRGKTIKNKIRTIARM